MSLIKDRPRCFGPAWIFWPLCAGLTLLVFRILPYDSILVEKYFSQMTFEWFRMIWDYSFSLLPIPCFYLVILASLCYLLYPVFVKPRQRLWRILLCRTIVVSSIGVITFYWFWGFNYKRVSFRHQISLQDARPIPSFVYEEYCRVQDSLTHVKALLSDGTATMPSLEDLNRDLESTLDAMGLEAPGKVKVVRLRPKGILLRLSTAGVYLPFMGQGHIDAGLHPITHPFTMIHEMSHGYGWTGEDVCNFLALKATLSSENPSIRYSGYFGYWRYLRTQVFLMDRELFELEFRSGPEEIMIDYQEILRYADRYPDILPEIRDWIYDGYLKSHGISSGLINYSEMILLSYQWQQAYGDLSSRDSILN